MTAGTAALTDRADAGRAAGDELVFSAWSVVSPFGVGAEAFAAGLREGRSAVAPLGTAVEENPYEMGALVPEFTAAGALGKKGTRTMDRVTALAVSTVGRLLDAAGEGLLERPERVGLVLGTGSGSVQSIMDFTRDSLTGERPYLVDPARFPNTVMNRATGQSAIWYGVKGPNTTISGGWLTGLLALGYAARLFRAGHCDRVLCGSAEEFSAQRAWLEWHAAGEERTPLGEGGAAWLLEPAGEARAQGRTPLATLLGTRFRAYQDPADAGAALTACVRGALEDAGVPAGDVTVVAPLGTPGEEAAVLAALAPGAGPKWLRCRPLVGDASAAATAFQVAAVLAEAAGGSPGGLALVTGIDRDGTVGCALLAL
ncbi:beta-ketoacyl synthase N-terminal-like domain-containing protein [Streptomyces sp. NPDC056367]|uniref:beta-ketoacyl synthase N-terminal-like domain-containing protein n=1 Tax=Streptomyces sp. NPDC056367 TaxID=3345797 RepID=UPI0035DB768D